MNTHAKHLGIRSLVLIVVIAAILFAGIRISGAAAQAAIPGDALYPVKTSIEQTRLSLAQDAGDRAQLRMGFAEQRLEEIAALIEEGRYTEVNAAVLAFEADIHGAILELETISQVDPARGTRIALEITKALTLYAQTLSAMAANAPQSVVPVVSRALDTTQIASGLEMPPSGLGRDDNGNDNANGDDDNANTNGDDDSANNNGSDDNSNDNGNDDNSNGSSDDIANSNDSGDDDNSNANVANGNGNDDNTNSSGIDDNVNSNGDDDSANSNGNGGDDNTNASNGNGDDNPNANSNSTDDSGNDNADDSGGGGSDDNGNSSGGDDHGGNGNDRGNDD